MDNNNNDSQTSLFEESMEENNNSNKTPEIKMEKKNEEPKEVVTPKETKEPKVEPKVKEEPKTAVGKDVNTSATATPRPRAKAKPKAEKKVDEIVDEKKVIEIVDEASDKFGEILDVVPDENKTNKEEDNESSPFKEMPDINVTDVTPIEKIKSVSDNNKKEVKEIVIPQTMVDISVADKNVAKTFGEFADEVDDLLEECKVILTIPNDDTGKLAKDIGIKANKLIKKIEKHKNDANRPLKAREDANRDYCKKFVKPLGSEVDRIKNILTAFELQKERKRQADLKKIEEEKKEGEKKKEQQIERANTIKKQISTIRTISLDKLSKCTDKASLDELTTQLKGWKPKQTLFQEFLDDTKKMVKEVLKTIEEKYKLLDENGKLPTEEKSDQPQGFEVEKETNPEMSEETETEEIQAQEKLITLLSKLEIEKVIDVAQGYVEVYGTAVIAYENKDKIINELSQSKVLDEKEEELASNSMKNMRTEHKFEITDATKVPKEFLMVDEKKIKSAITDNRKILIKDINSFKIEGVKITSEQKVILRD